MIETVEQRIARLLDLRERLDDEIARLMGVEQQTPKRRRSRFVVPECGTESGYQRHRHRGEVCEACKKAHREHERVRAMRARWVRLREAS